MRFQMDSASGASTPASSFDVGNDQTCPGLASHHRHICAWERHLNGPTSSCNGLPLLGGNPGYSIGPGARSRNTTCGRAASSCQSSTISPATFVVLQSERFNDQSVTRL